MIPLIAQSMPTQAMDWFCIDLHEEVAIVGGEGSPQCDLSIFDHLQLSPLGFASRSSLVYAWCSLMREFMPGQRVRGVVSRFEALRYLASAMSSSEAE